MSIEATSIGRRLRQAMASLRARSSQRTASMMEDDSTIVAPVKIPMPLGAVDITIPGGSLSVRGDILDGWAIHAAALEHGVNTTLFPGQVLLCHGPEGAQGAFANGVPNSSRLSTVSFTQDNHIRRELVAARDVPVPRARSFSVGSGLADALEYAEHLGYPVVLKPVLNDSTIEVIAGVTDSDDLIAAWQYYGTVPTLRSDFTAGSYSITQPMTPRKGGGTRTRRSYRILVEEQVHGQYLRLLIVDGELVSCVIAPDGPWQTYLAQEILENIHPSVRDIAQEVWAAYPGLTVMAVDVVLRDYTAEQSEGSWQLVELSERPWLFLQHQTQTETFRHSATRILQAELASSSTDMSLNSVSKEVAVSFRWEGISRPGETVEEIAALSRTAGLVGWAHVHDTIGGVITGHWQGTAPTIALLNELAVSDDLLRDSVMCARLQHEPRADFSSFSLR